MEALFSRSIGLPIVDQHSHLVVGRLSDIIIDTETGKIIAFALLRGQIVVPLDIIEWRPDHLVISDMDHIVHADDVVRIQAVLQRHIPVFANRVVTEADEYIGRVVDMVFNTKTFELKNLFVAKLFLIFKYDHRIISVKNIIEIKKEKIIVKDILGKEKDKAKVPSLIGAS